MRKIMLILAIFGLMVLSSCNTPDTNAKSESTPDITDSNPTETNSSESSSSNTNEENIDNSTSNQTNSKEPETTLPDYDDGIDWHGTVD